MLNLTGCVGHLGLRPRSLLRRLVVVAQGVLDLVLVVLVGVFRGGLALVLVVFGEVFLWF